MKSFVLILLLGSYISCSNSSLNKFSSEPGNNTSNSSPILEISSNFEGLWWMNGSVLDFRLYDKGIIEYDEYPLQNNKLNELLEAEKVKSTKRFVLDQKESDNLNSVLKKLLISKSPNNIIPKLICIDASIDTKININFNNSLKQININQHCSDLSEKGSVKPYFKNFPSEIVELFQIIEKIKNKNSQGKFYN